MASSSGYPLNGSKICQIRNSQCLDFRGNIFLEKPVVTLFGTRRFEDLGMMCIYHIFDCDQLESYSKNQLRSGQ